MEFVASGLAGCIAIDVILILRKQRIDPDVFTIDIQASLAEGTPSPFEKIHLIFTLDEQIDQDRLTKNIQLVMDKYCSVRASLAPFITITFEIKNYEIS